MFRKAKIMANHHAAAEVLAGKETQLQVTFGVVGAAAMRPLSPIHLKQTEQCDVSVSPDGGTRYTREVSIGTGEFVSPSSNLPTLRGGQRVIVTQSIATALAVEHATDFRAVAALNANNLRHVAGELKGAGCDVVIAPDNYDLSRAAARDAARATGAKIANPKYAPGQRNLLSALADSFAAIRERFPSTLEPNEVAGTLANSSVRMSEEQAARMRLVADSIVEAKPWTPGMGRSERIHEVSHAMSSGADIGR
jgi:hypothetical protein